MTDLLLREGEQAAVRAVLAAEGLPGSALPGESALPHVARLIACDACGIVLLDSAGSAVEESSGARSRPAEDDRVPPDGPILGIHRRPRAPTRRGPAGRRAVSVLSLGVRNGTDHVVKLWMVRGGSDFSERDRALLVLVAPALERLMRERITSPLPPSLTLQERRVLSHVAAGLSNAEIADRLFLSPCTVGKHLEHAYRKLGVTNRWAAVVAIEGGRQGVLDPDEPGPRRTVLARPSG